MRWWILRKQFVIVTGTNEPSSWCYTDVFTVSVPTASWFGREDPAQSCIQSSLGTVLVFLNLYSFFGHRWTDINSCSCSTGSVQRKATLKIESMGTNGLPDRLFWGGGWRIQIWNNVIKEDEKDVEFGEVWGCDSLKKNVQLAKSMDMRHPRRPNVEFQYWMQPNV